MAFHLSRSILLPLLLLALSNTSHAQYLQDKSNQSQRSTPNSDGQRYLLAQNEPDEAYDPFSDYSEFDEASDEEADINFFRHGRFFTVGLIGGYRGFTEGMADAYTAGPTFGVFVSYFFDLRLALNLGFQTGDHSVTIKTNLNNYTGNVSLTAFTMNLKYYLSTQNLSRGLADINPYLVGGFSSWYRTYSLSGVDGFSRDSTMGMDFGAGIEIPLMRKKAYLGIQGAYHYVNFSDENKQFANSGSEQLKTRINGDFFDVIGILGMNF